MKNIVFTIFATAILAVLPVNAIADNSQVTKVWGNGNADCAGIVAAKSPAGGAVYQWLSGFITAYNVYSYNGTDIAGSMGGEELHAWILEYCRENPSDVLFQATHALVGHLKEEQNK